MDVTCPSCAAENYDSARYCRKCGAQLGSAEFHEAPTRGLDHQRPPDPQPPARAFETFGSAQLPNDGPRYAPPVVSSSAAGLQPANLTGMPTRVETGPMSAPTGPAGKGPPWFLIIGAIVLAAFIGGVSMLVLVADRLKNNLSDRQPPPARGSSDSGEKGPPVTPPPGAPVATSIESWQYDGATNTSSPVPNVLIMETDDDIDDVTEFYREKFDALGIKPGYVKDPDDHSTVFMGGPSAGNIIIAISPPDADEGGGGDGNTTEIVVTGGGSGFPGFPGVPPIPNVPEVPAPPAPPTPSPSKTGEAPKTQPAETPKTLKQPK